MANWHHIQGDHMQNKENVDRIERKKTILPGERERVSNNLTSSELIKVSMFNLSVISSKRVHFPLTYHRKQWGKERGA